jgi:hypothetical protein
MLRRVNQRQFVFGSDVGFSAEWVCRRQGGERNLGSIAIQAPWLSRHAAGPFLCTAAFSEGGYTHIWSLIGLRPVSADVTSSR